MSAANPAVQQSARTSTRRARLLELVDLAGTSATSAGDEAAYDLTYARVPSRRLDWLIGQLLTMAADGSLPCERRGQLAEAIGSQLQYSKRRKPPASRPTGSSNYSPIRVSRSAFWSAFSLGTIRAREARRALTVASSDSSIVEGWWSVGAEAADALAIIDGVATDWRTANRAGTAASE